MKTSILRHGRWLLCALGMLASRILAVTECQAPTLKVHVNAPSSWVVSHDREFADELAASLHQTLLRQGVACPVSALRAVEDPAKIPYLLRVEVKECHPGPLGDVCTFAVTLKTPAGVRRLGQYAWPAAGVLASPSRPACSPFAVATLAALGRDLSQCALPVVSSGECGS